MQISDILKAVREGLCRKGLYRVVPAAELRTGPGGNTSYRILVQDGARPVQMFQVPDGLSEKDIPGFAGSIVNQYCGIFCDTTMRHFAFSDYNGK
jgi:hypothetical protein